MGALIRFALRVVLRIAAVAAVLLLALRFVPPPTSSFMLQSRVTEGEWPAWDWVPAREVSPHLLLAVVAAEDQRFDRHRGFDLQEIEEAARQNARGGPVRGASTISQQVAKNLFLWPGRSWIRKAVEAGLTVLLEALWPKRRILEVYVNVAQFGDRLFGVEAAARRYYGVTARDLTQEQAALLAAALPNPGAFDPQNPPEPLQRRQKWILEQMKALGGTGWLRRL